jgi:hypothetical protein
MNLTAGYKTGFHAVFWPVKSPYSRKKVVHYRRCIGYWWLHETLSPDRYNTFADNQQVTLKAWL